MKKRPLPAPKALTGVAFSFLDFWRLCLPLFTGMTLSLLFCAIVPNGTDLRPAYIYGNDIFTRAVRALWRTDTSTNVFPNLKNAR